MALIPTIPSITKGNWDSVISSNRFLQKYLKKLTSSGLGSGSAPTFLGMTITGLTASRLIAADASKGLESVGNLASWVAGTANQLTVTDDSDGTITLSLPQDIHTGASPTFTGGTFSAVVTGVTPTDDPHFATKEYVDLATSSLSDSLTLDGGTSDVTLDSFVWDAGVSFLA